AKSEAALRAVQRPRAAHDNVFKIYWVTTVQSPLKRLESIQVYQADPTLENAFAVSAALVVVALLVAVGRLGRHCNTRFLVSRREANCEAPSYPRGRRQMNAPEATIPRLSGSKNGLAEQCAAR